MIFKTSLAQLELPGWLSRISPVLNGDCVRNWEANRIIELIRTWSSVWIQRSSRCCRIIVIATIYILRSWWAVERLRIVVRPWRRAILSRGICSHDRWAVEHFRIVILHGRWAILNVLVGIAWHWRCIRIIGWAIGGLRVVIQLSWRAVLLCRIRGWCCRGSRRTVEGIGIIVSFRRWAILCSAIWRFCCCSWWTIERWRVVVGLCRRTILSCAICRSCRRSCRRRRTIEVIGIIVGLCLWAILACWVRSHRSGRRCHCCRWAIERIWGVVWLSRRAVLRCWICSHGCGRRRHCHRWAIEGIRIVICILWRAIFGSRIRGNLCRRRCCWWAIVSGRIIVILSGWAIFGRRICWYRRRSISCWRAIIWVWIIVCVFRGTIFRGRVCRRRGSCRWTIEWLRIVIWFGRRAILRSWVFSGGRSSITRSGRTVKWFWIVVRFGGRTILLCRVTRWWLSFNNFCFKLFSI